MHRVAVFPRQPPLNHLLQSWRFWALSAAGCAALTAIHVKVGVASVQSDVAAFVRTRMIVASAGAIVVGSGQTGGSCRSPAATWSP